MKIFESMVNGILSEKKKTIVSILKPELTKLIDSDIQNIGWNDRDGDVDDFFNDKGIKLNKKMPLAIIDFSDSKGKYAMIEIEYLGEERDMKKYIKSNSSLIKISESNDYNIEWDEKISSENIGVLVVTIS